LEFGRNAFWEVAIVDTVNQEIALQDSGTSGPATHWISLNLHYLNQTCGNKQLYSRTAKPSQIRNPWNPQFPKCCYCDYINIRQQTAIFLTVILNVLYFVSAEIKHPHYCRFRRSPPGRGRGKYSTRDSKFCLAEPRRRRYHRSCAKRSSSRGRSIGRARCS
jgi:hypothetical protein